MAWLCALLHARDNMTQMLLCVRTCNADRWWFSIMRLPYCLCESRMKPLTLSESEAHVLLCMRFTLARQSMQGSRLTSASLPVQNLSGD